MKGKPAYEGGTSYEVWLKNGDRLEIRLSGPNGIDEIELQSTNRKTIVYRIDGTRVKDRTLSPGMYIINGKKIIINK